MTSFPYFTTLILGSSFTASLILLWLQVSAFRRNRHSSFLLLSIATVFGLIYLVLTVLGGFFLTSLTLRKIVFYSAGISLLTQFVVGVWGTAYLFRTYGQLHDATKANAQAPNQRLERP
jgi:hypothetical protein